MVNPTGYTALDMIGFTDKGPYSSSANYVKNDLVHDSGNIWRCLIDDTTGIAPAEGVNWTLFIGEPTNLVERIIAPVETDPATNAWTVGRQIIFNDNLYEVITAISAGDALVAYEDDPANANIKLADPVETQLLNLKGNVSNRNLIDNAWFSVNQRGVTSWNDGYGLDRWKITPSGHMTCNVVSGGITLTYDGSSTYTEIQQRLDDDVAQSLDGKTVTLSAIINGQLYQGSAVYSYSVNGSPIVVDIDGGKYQLVLRNIPNQTGRCIVRFISNASESFTSQTISAMKLEKGSISTLLADTVPNYAEELLKCQRYFQRLGTSNVGVIGTGFISSATQAIILVPLSCQMRTNPTVTLSGTLSIMDYTHLGSSTYECTAIVPNGTSNNIIPTFLIFCTISGGTAGNSAMAQFRDTTSYIDFSADL